MHILVGGELCLQNTEDFTVIRPYKRIEGDNFQHVEILGRIERQIFGQIGHLKKRIHRPAFQ